MNINEFYAIRCPASFDWTMLKDSKDNLFVFHRTATRDQIRKALKSQVYEDDEILSIVADEREIFVQVASYGGTDSYTETFTKVKLTTVP